MEVGGTIARDTPLIALRPIVSEIVVSSSGGVLRFMRTEQCARGPSQPIYAREGVMCAPCIQNSHCSLSEAQ